MQLIKSNIAEYVPEHSPGETMNVEYACSLVREMKNVAHISYTYHTNKGVLNISLVL